MDLYTTVSTGWRNASARVRTTLLHSRSNKTACASVALVGIDAAPSPGLRGPTNFLGVATSGLLHDLDMALRSLSSSPRYRHTRSCTILASANPRSYFWVFLHAPTVTARSFQP